MSTFFVQLQSHRVDLCRFFFFFLVSSLPFYSSARVCISKHGRVQSTQSTASKIYRVVQKSKPLSFCVITRDVKSSWRGRPWGSILWLGPRSRPHSCWPQPRSRSHELWSRSRASWPSDLDNWQVDGNYELSTSFSVLSLSPWDFLYLLILLLYDVYFRNLW